MTDKRFKELYTEYKSHPLVAFFISQLSSKGGRLGISEVWKKFIQQTDDTTDMSILRVQLVNWGIISQVDTELRGEELLEAVESTQLKPYFSDAWSVKLNSSDMEFPLALEKVLIAKISSNWAGFVTFNGSDFSIPAE